VVVFPRGSAFWFFVFIIDLEHFSIPGHETFLYLFVMAALYYIIINLAFN
jgi:hypothetical protein